jgi:hypothetical protein
MNLDINDDDKFSEEFDKMLAEEATKDNSEQTEIVENTEEESNDTDEEVLDENGTSDTNNNNDVNEENTNSVDENIVSEEETNEEIEASKEKVNSSGSKDEADVSSNDSEEEEKTDYKSYWDSVTNITGYGGVKIKIDKPEDAITLIQKGLNYTKKMQEIKPSKQIIDTLADNDLLDHDKINLAIDIMKGNKEAIAKHLKDLNIDGLEINTEEANYNPSNYFMSEADYNNSEVIKELSKDTHGSEVLKAVSLWDEQSRKELSNNFERDLTMLAEHKRTGQFDAVMGDIQLHKSLGKLSGVSDAQAYVHFYTQRFGNQQTAQQATTTQNKVETKQTEATQTKSNPKVTNTDKVNRLATTKKGSVKTPKKNVNDLLAEAQSDEEFDKIFNKYLKQG